MHLRIVILCVALVAGFNTTNGSENRRYAVKANSIRNRIGTFTACSEPSGTFLPDDDNCKDYFICIGGDLYQFTCGDGNYIFEDGYCKEDVDYRCNPRPTTEPPPEYDCSTEQTGSFIPLDGECSKYQLCIGGESIPLDCPEGFLFSKELKYCIADTTGVCWGLETTTTSEPTPTTTEEPTPTTTEEPTPTTTAEPTPTTTAEPTPTTTEEPTPTTTEEPTPTPTSEPTPTTTAEPIPTTTEEPTRMTTVDPTPTTTEEPTPTTTAEPTPTTTEEPTPTTTAEPTPTTTAEPTPTTTEEPTPTTTGEPTPTTTPEPTPTANICEGITIGYVPHPDCTKFYMCMNEEPSEPQACPAGDYFNSVTSQCETDVTGDCVNRCKSSPSGTRFPNDENCQGYFECQSGVEYTLACQDGYYFNGATLKCVEDVDNICGSTSPTICQNQADGKIIPHGECGSYYICNNNEAEVENCENGYRFDVQQMECVVDATFSCICELNAQAVFGSLICNEYYECANGVASIKNCPEGEYFQPNELSCIVDENETCLVTTSTTPVSTTIA